MAALYGHIGEFVETQEEWRQYAERIQHYFAANGVTDAERKRAIFLSVIGPRTYKLLSSLVAPSKPGEKTYDELVVALTEHHSPAPSEIVQRFKFNSRFRYAGESVATYVAELRSIAQTCNYGSSLDEMLRDRIVCGINDDRIQQRLLSEKGLTYKKALELSQGLETAAKNVRELQSTKQEPAQVHKVTPGRRGGVQTAGVARGCFRCGNTAHSPSHCPFKGARCHNCGKVGHIRKTCRKPKNPVGGGQAASHKDKSVRVVQEPGVEQDSIQNEYPLYCLSDAGRSKPINIEVVIDGKPLTMELDTGAAVSLVSESTYQEYWPDRQLQECKTQLSTYSGEPLGVLGTLEVEVQYEEQRAHLPLFVLKGEGPSLFGRNWLESVRLDWKRIHQVQGSSLQDVLYRHQEVFGEELGMLKGYEAKIHIDVGATPRFCRARPVPYAMRVKVEQELERLVCEGILEPVQHSDWAAPIVPVLKGDKSVRICGDFKMTVNQASKLDRYPIPRVEDLLATLAGGKTFTKLDMSQAYQQLVLDEKSKDLVVVNTHRGLFRYTRLPFGIASAPGVFQRVMESLLRHIPGVIVYIDDILVTGPTDEEHLVSLEEVLDRIESAGLRLKRKKCLFMAKSVVFLGYQIDAQGLHPVAEKVRAVQEARDPRNVSELKSYLGLLTYYSRFLPNMATVLNPLYNLLRKAVPWRWTACERRAFEASKELLVSSQVLVHFDSKLELVLACDASAYGVGAVLSHRMPDGTEKPIAFASRTLSDTERRYSQVEKEALAIVFGVKHFHSYIYGRHFYLQTDHKPLTTLLSESRSVPQMASGRIMRWALTLSSYEYTLVFRSTTQHGNADAMSRLPLPESPREIPDSREIPDPAEWVLLIEGLKDSPISSAQIRTWTRRDSLVSQVLRCVQQGWPTVVTEELKPYWNRRLELSVYDGCLLWGSRVVVPPPGRNQALRELYGGHPGCSRMKSLARMFCWWPGMDAEIETLVRQCPECQEDRPGPPPSPLQPSRPWSRLHIDYAGPFLGHMFLVLIDAHSKWIEVYPVRAATSNATIQQLRITFAQFGIPETVVSDNGQCFVSAEFEEFLSRNGIKHLKSAPYHPASNGLAERAVQIFKRGMKKMKAGSLTDRIARVLFNYRITPQTTTGLSPAELLMSRRLSSRLDLMVPSVSRRVQQSQSQQKMTHDFHASDREVAEGDRVYARNFGPRAGTKWLPGEVVQKTGPLSCQVQLQDGTVWRRHQDHIRKRFTEQAEEVDTPLETVPQEESWESTPNQTESSPEDGETSERKLEETPARQTQQTERRYPTRVHRPPERYSDTL